MKSHHSLLYTGDGTGRLRLQQVLKLGCLWLSPVYGYPTIFLSCFLKWWVFLLLFLWCSAPCYFRGILIYFQRAPFLSRYLIQMPLLAWTCPLAFHIVSSERPWDGLNYVALMLVSVSASCTYNHVNSLHAQKTCVSPVRRHNPGVISLFNPIKNKVLMVCLKERPVWTDSTYVKFILYY